MNRRTAILGTAAAAAALFAGGAAIYSRTAPETPPVPAAPVAPATDGQLFRPHAPVLGPFSAKVTIVEFFDPSCEACRAFYPFVKQLMDANPNQIRVVLRYALFHPASEEAGRILEAARKQDKFQPVLEALLGRQEEWGADGAPKPARAWEIAGEVGLDVEKAKKDAVTPEVDAVIAQDGADVKAIGVTKTPTFFVNGKPLPSFGAQQLSDLVQSELAAAK